MGTKIPLKRELGLFEVTLSGIGIILGAGIYALTVRGGLEDVLSSLSV